MIAGGALYNNLDYSFAVGHEDGSFVYPDTQPGGGSAALRRQLKVLKDFIDGFDFVRMSPDMSAIKGGVPRSGTARALVEPNRAMAIYVRKESPTGPWSARWTGVLTAPVSGEYVFHTFSNDGVRLWIDDTQLIDNWTDHTETEDVGRITLSAGTTHRVRLEYFYNGGQGATKLWWTLPDGAGKGVKQPVPASALQHSGPQGGAGLRGEYFKGNDLKNAWAERSDAQIDFVWGTTAPISAASSDAPALQVELAEGNWQAEWVDPSTGKIVLTTRVDGGGVRAINPPSYETDIALRLRLAAPDQRRPPKGGRYDSSVWLARRLALSSRLADSASCDHARMPELPEVEAVRRELAPAMLRSRIVRVLLRRQNLRRPFPAGFASRLEGQTIDSIDRRGKYLLVRVTSGETLLMHLGMSGSFRVDARSRRRDRGPANSPADPHDHVVFELSNGSIVTFNDPRRFGVMDLIEAEPSAGRGALHALGLEPLDAAFDAAALARACAGRRVALKVALLDQRTVAGLGNIYASEALHRAGLSPLRRASTIATVSGRPRAHAVRLTSAIKSVLLEAIARSERPYRAGRFRVYEREGERCPKRGCGGTIRRIWQAGRSTFYCPRCQR